MQSILKVGLDQIQDGINRAKGAKAAIRPILPPGSLARETARRAQRDAARAALVAETLDEVAACLSRCRQRLVGGCSPHEAELLARLERTLSGAR